MKKVSIYLIVLFSFTTVIGINSCSPSDEIEQEEPPIINPNPTPEPAPNPTPPVTGNKGIMIVGSATFTFTLEDNATADGFKQMLPMTINMSELNNNEKYYVLSQSLPTNASKPETIRNGDLMLYGSSTLVVFYKTFSTSYSYTRIGLIDNPAELESALGTGSVTVTFEMEK